MTGVDDLTPEQIVYNERRHMAHVYFSMFLLEPYKNPELSLEIEADLGILYDQRGFEEVPKRDIRIEDFLEMAEDPGCPMHELMSWDNDQVLLDRYLDRLNILKDPNQDGTFTHKLIEASWIKFKNNKKF